MKQQQQIVAIIQIISSVPEQARNTVKVKITVELLKLCTRQSYCSYAQNYIATNMHTKFEVVLTEITVIFHLPNILITYLVSLSKF